MKVSRTSPGGASGTRAGCPVPARKVGKLILAGVPEVRAGTTIVYARVCCADQAADLDRQVARVVAWCGEDGMAVDGRVTDAGSALAGHRRRFVRLLADSGVQAIVVRAPGSLRPFRS